MRTLLASIVMISSQCFGAEMLSCVPSYKYRLHILTDKIVKADLPDSAMVKYTNDFLLFNSLSFKRDPKNAGHTLFTSFPLQVDDSRVVLVSLDKDHTLTTFTLRPTEVYKTKYQCQIVTFQ
jgi:hypothetical protein